MTNTQHIVGWIIYLLGSTGCIVALWYIVKNWPTRLKRVMCIGMAGLVYVPWLTTPGQSWLAPAFLIAIYDGLGRGPEEMLRAGLIVVVSVGASIALALCLPVKKSSESYEKTTFNMSGSTKKMRREPTW